MAASTDAAPLPLARPAWKRWLIDSAIARIVIFVAITLAIGTVMMIVFQKAGWTRLHNENPIRLASELLIRVIPMGAAYLAIVHFIERRRADELALGKALPHLAAGTAGGVLFIGGTMLVLWLAGAYEVTGINGDVHWLRPILIYSLGTAFAEEIIFRGVLFRIVDETLGLSWALAISALFFGGVHIMNQNATLWTSFAIAIEAGILLGVLYHVTRTLWACIGLHAAWNLVQGTVFASPVSGTRVESSVFAARFDGPEWLTGGAFGVEGSVVAVLLSLAISFALLAAARRWQGQNGPMPT